MYRNAISLEAVHTHTHTQLDDFKNSFYKQQYAIFICYIE